MFKVRDKSIAIFPSPEAYLEKNIYDEPFLRYIDDKTLDASGQILEEHILHCDFKNLQSGCTFCALEETLTTKHLFLKITK